MCSSCYRNGKSIEKYIKMKYKNIIFDYDGTLHNSIKIYAPAFRSTYNYLVDKGYVSEKIFSDTEISRWLGYTSNEMWDLFLPNLPVDEKRKCSEKIGSLMIKYINEGKAELYKGSYKVLNILKNKGYNLIFLSNCKINYMNLHIEKFNLNNYFHDFYCSEEFNNIPKYKIFNYIKQKYKGDFIVIGDRKFDIEIAKIHNLFSIGCSYGYGRDNELDYASKIAKSVYEILHIINLENE